MTENYAGDIAKQCFVDIDDIRFIAVSPRNRFALDGRDSVLPDPLKIDLFNTSRTNFCGWLDCYFNESHTDGSMCFTDWCLKGGKSQIKSYDLPFEAVFGIGMVPNNPVDMVSGAILRAKIIHDRYADSDNWKDLDFVLSQRIDQEYMERTNVGIDMTC